MHLNKFLLKSGIVLALFIGAFSEIVFTQTIKAEKTGSVASNIRDQEEDSDFNRKRIVKSENDKNVASAKLSANQIFNLEKQTFALINEERAKIGLSLLNWSDDVAKIARLHSENMAKFNFFSHTGIDGKMVNDRADTFGITKWTAMGENIAYNRGYKNPIECVVEKWMQSPSHRENLLNNRWKESAIGIAVTDDGTYYFTQVFLVRK
ncbi:MAG: CAP domain-containing protein [Actinomycetota bacterium]